MRTSCISHPENERLIIVREWQVEFCGGNRCAAMLLSFFEYWHNIKIEQSFKNAQSNNVAEAHGDERTHDESLWQFHNSEELVDGLLGTYGEKMIRDGIKFLVEKEILEVSKNPNPRYKFDRTNWFLFKPEAAKTWLAHRPAKTPPRSGRKTESNGKNAEWSGENAEWSGKNAAPDGENAAWCGKNAGTITEITSEIPFETSSKISTETHSLSAEAQQARQPTKGDGERESPIILSPSNPHANLKPNREPTKLSKSRQINQPALTATDGHEPTHGTAGKSQFPLLTCFEYVQHLQSEGRFITSPEGLARGIYLDGTSDPFIELWQEKRQRAEESEQRAASVPRREFSDDPCRMCFGIKRERVEGNRFTDKPCLDCRDEHNRATGKEPLETTQPQEKAELTEVGSARIDKILEVRKADAIVSQPPNMPLELEDYLQEQIRGGIAPADLKTNLSGSFSSHEWREVENRINDQMLSE